VKLYINVSTHFKMTHHSTLIKFVNAQEHYYKLALGEIKKGKKTGHWMWYIFPQIIGLGYSETTRFFAIRDKDEATEYLSHPLLGPRLIEISNELLNLSINDPVAVFGSVDSLKLKSSMTLFSIVERTDPVFQSVLDKFFGGSYDMDTIHILNA
jgi:uncharacterized protein (DUF1810 family)